MQPYTVCFLDKGNHVVATRDVLVPDDDGAIVRAKYLCGAEARCVAIEVWAGNRLVHRESRTEAETYISA